MSESSQHEELEETSEGNTVVMTMEEIKESIRQGHSGIDWDLVNSLTEEDIERMALEDNRRHGIPDDWYKKARMVRFVEKEQISIRLDKDVLDFFRKQGRGYQTRINAVLRVFVEASEA